ncbi:MAG: glycosyltransferase family 2 protein [Candidatus Kerfeldbacteria bacterium]|nr:glycosyltransferase family 2 protein [Candidatus Kerfeldbacteria bacterium]
MKLIVTIPCFNEAATLEQVIREIPRQVAGYDQVAVLVLNDGSTDDTVAIAQQAGADYVISHKGNLGLARTFQHALWEALQHGADTIVNTDGDNHYDQSRIGELVQPIVAGQADIVIGSRKNLHTKNRFLNKLGSFIMTKWAGLPRYDVSTGFRAYSQEAALRLGVYSTHTYVHTTLLSAQDLGLVTVEVPMADRPVQRPSRLIKNVRSHIWKAGWNIVRNIVIFRPLRFFGSIGILLTGLGIAPLIRFLYFLAIGQGGGHVQSIIIGTMLILLGYINVVLGLLGSSIGWHRKVSEEILYRLKRLELESKQ